MFGRENADMAIDSGEVDVEFWALVFQNEKWLRAQFDAANSEPDETPARSSGPS